MSRAILYATDFSSASGVAFNKAVELARREHAPLLITHVMASPMPMMAGDGYVPPGTWEAIAKGYRKTSQKQLDAAVRRAKRAGARARGLLLQGTPAADTDGRRRLDAACAERDRERCQVLDRVAPAGGKVVHGVAPRVDDRRGKRLEHPQQHDGHVERSGDVREERQDALAGLGTVERHEDPLIHGPPRAPAHR